MPRMSPCERCALTAPFQPYQHYGLAVYFLLHYPSGYPALPLAGTLIREVLGLSSPASDFSKSSGDRPSPSQRFLRIPVLPVRD